MMQRLGRQNLSVQPQLEVGVTPSAVPVASRTSSRLGAEDAAREFLRLLSLEFALAASDLACICFKTEDADEFDAPRA